MISGTGFASARISGRSRHLRQPFRLEHAGRGKPQEDVRALHDVGERAGVGPHRVARLVGVHLGGAPFVDDAGDVGDDDVLACAGPGRPAGRGRLARPRRHPRRPASTLPMSLPTTRSPLRTAALTTMAVPCWSSWKTGIFIRRCSPASISKHSGALMSSRLMPPKVGSSARDGVDELLGVALVDLDVEHVDAGELLEQHRLAFHHRLRRRAGRSRPARAPRCRSRSRATKIAARGVVEGGRRVALDLLAGRARRRASKRARGRAGWRGAWWRGSPAFPGAGGGGSRGRPSGDRRTWGRYLGGQGWCSAA